jgi:ADP-ribosylglycohydrolase
VKSDKQRLELAAKALWGIAIGDAFGESFFGEGEFVEAHIQARTVPPTSWEFTDDTVMALAVYEELEQDGRIQQDRLAAKFAHNYALDNRRGYGGTAHKVLREIGEGLDWREVSRSVFDGMGSMGNGAAMRVGPLGAFHASSDGRFHSKEDAVLSAEVTHANAEAIGGAIAVAVATELATQIGLRSKFISAAEFITQVASQIPECDTKYKVANAANLPVTTHIETLKTVLGNGSRMLAQDTVPFAIWCAAHHLDHFEEALWHAVSALGDRDTIAAMVGGIVIMSCDPDTVPKGWQTSVENPFLSLFRSST